MAKHGTPEWEQEQNAKLERAQARHAADVAKAAAAQKAANEKKAAEAAQKAANIAERNRKAAENAAKLKRKPK